MFRAEGFEVVSELQIEPGVYPLVDSDGVLTDIGEAASEFFPVLTKVWMQHICTNLGGNTKSFVLIGMDGFFIFIQPPQPCKVSEERKNQYAAAQ